MQGASVLQYRVKHSYPESYWFYLCCALIGLPTAIIHCYAWPPNPHIQRQKINICMSRSKPPSFYSFWTEIWRTSLSNFKVYFAVFHFASQLSILLNNCLGWARGSRWALHISLFPHKDGGENWKGESGKTRGLRWKQFGNGNRIIIIIVMIIMQLIGK